MGIEMKAFVLAAAMVMGAAGVVHAACAPIAEPTAVPGIEDIKSKLLAQDPAGAFENFNINAETKAKIIDDLSKTLAGPSPVCVAIKRARPSENFASELFFIESQGRTLYFAVSGVIREGKFTLMGLRFTSDFEVFRDSIY